MPEERITQLENEVKELKAVLSALVFSDRYIFSKSIQIQDGRNIQTAIGVGSKIGTTSTEKLAFWGAVPIVRPSAIADLSVVGSAQDSDARGKINDILTMIRSVGIIP